MDGDTFVLFDLFFLVMIVVLVIWFIKRSQARQNANQDGPTQTAAQPVLNPSQVAQDIKSTQTSRIVDAVQVLDELGTATGQYRHYCELVGTSMASGGVTAPYSKRQVAYYDLRCYRIENNGVRDVETLVAQEKSIDPFYFTDGSGDQKVFVDLQSFGSNCILVNATNRIEGPNSDFAKAMNSAMTSQGSSGTAGAYAAWSRAIERGSNVLAGAARASEQAFGAARAAAYRMQLGIAYATRAFTPMQPAFAGVAANASAQAPALPGQTAPSKDANFKFDHDGPRLSGFGGMGGFGGLGGPHHGGHPGNMGIPGGLDSFLGGAFSGGHMSGMGGPSFRPQNSGSGDIGGALLGMGLGVLIASLGDMDSNTNQQQTTQRTSFRGYRVIEDVVPLSSPIYCLGEIYRNGTDVYAGRSTSDTYPSSYFATKHEADVLTSLR